MDSLMFATGLTTLALGGAMTLMAWRVVLQNRRQAAARVELLSALAFPDAARSDTSGSDASFHNHEFEVDEFQREQPIATNALFAEPAISGAASRRTIALAAVGLVMVLLVGAYKWFAGPTASVPSTATAATTSTVAPPRAAAAATATADPRVELMALEHTVTTDELLVTGRVRNPAGGTPLHDVVAVVTIKDGAGRALTSARASVTPAVLNAGESSDFAVAAARAANAGGYSVSFDSRERHTIPHIDRRRAASSSPSD
jgi:hypothetical protein